MKLPSLKKWRIDRDLSQEELARMAGIHPTSLPRIERGERGCTLDTALKLAEALEVDVKDLQKPSPPEQVVRGRPRGTGRKLHQTSLKLLLEHTLGSSYMAMPEKELEMYCETLSWEEVIEVVSSREKEAKVLTDVLDLEDENLTKKRRAFFQEVLSSFPDLDICLLAKARRREKKGRRGRKELTEAMRELL